MEGGAQSLLGIKLGTLSLYENLLQNSNEVVCTVVILSDTFTNKVQSMCNICYMVGVHALQLLEAHSIVTYVLLTIVDF